MYENLSWHERMVTGLGLLIFGVLLTLFFIIIGSIVWAVTESLLLKIGVI